jgi:hypothetical protein
MLEVSVAGQIPERCGSAKECSCAWAPAGTCGASGCAIDGAEVLLAAGQDPTQLCLAPESAWRFRRLGAAGGIAGGPAGSATVSAKGGVSVQSLEPTLSDKARSACQDAAHVCLNGYVVRCDGAEPTATAVCERGCAAEDDALDEFAPDDRAALVLCRR